MLLRGIRFNYAFDQSGVRNFHGGGWPYHKYFKALGIAPRFNGASFVAKTTTLNPRRGKGYDEPGNMEINPADLMPKELNPDCIKVWFWQGIALNAVGLSGPGLASLLARGFWHEQDQPFMISLMAVGNTVHERLKEMECMVALLQKYSRFSQRFGIQVNITCPNVKHESQEERDQIAEVRDILQILRILGDDVALVPKINARTSIRVAQEMAADDNCDGLCNSNTIAWHEIPEVDRIRMFGTLESPLAKYNGGGISGVYLLGPVANWVIRARKAGIKKPIIAGGGILHPRHVDSLADAGASAIAVGSAAFLRPWRVQGIINHANELGQQQKFY